MWLVVIMATRTFCKSNHSKMKNGTQVAGSLFGSPGMEWRRAQSGTHRLNKLNRATENNLYDPSS